MKGYHGAWSIMELVIKTMTAYICIHMYTYLLGPGNSFQHLELYGWSWNTYKLDPGNQVPTLSL